MTGYSLVVSNQARSRLARFTRHELREIRRLLGLIQIDPTIDNINKIVVLLPPVVFSAYVTPRFRISYRVVDGGIEMLDFQRATNYEPVPW